MLLILEIGMLIGGIYSVVTTKVPAFLVDGGKYQVEGWAARLLGILLMFPALIAFFGGILMSYFFPENATDNAFVLEFLTLFVVVFLTLVLVRVVGKKKKSVDDIEVKIGKQAQCALMYAIFSCSGFAAIICCPLAFIYANQALTLMDQHSMGEQYRKKAKVARSMATFSSLLVFACVAISIFPSMILHFWGR